MNVHRSEFTKNDQIIFSSYGPNPDGLQLSITVPLRNNVIFDDLIKV